MDEQAQKIQALEAKVNALTKKIDDIYNSSLFPYDVEQSIKERIKPLQGVTATTADQTQDISLTGLVQTITVGKNPIGYLTVKFKEQTYNLLRI